MKNFFLSIVGGVISSLVASALIYFVSKRLFENLASNKLFIFFVILLSASVWLFIKLSVTNSQYKLSLEQLKKLHELSLDQYKLSLRDFEVNNVDYSKYSIVCIDDRAEWRQRIQSLISNYNITIINSVESAKLLYGFDIIITDIQNAANLSGGAKNIIKDLFKSKPYKYIIAISHDTDLLLDIAPYVSVTIPKNDNFDRAIDDELLKAFSMLDKPSDYWEKEILPRVNRNNAQYNKESYERMYVYELLSSSIYNLRNSKKRPM